MSDERQIEIDRNYDFFQRNLSKYLKDHAGQYALLKGANLIAFFDGPGEAYRDGLARFADELFSIQEVRSEPIHLGHMSF